jgi:Na+-driven multidrug efflux pump
MSSADVQAPEGNERVGAHTAVRDLLVVAAPTIATMTSYTLMQFVDKLLVSRIGPDPVYVGAQGNGGLAAFVPIAIAMGFLTVVNTYVAQNLGAGKPERAPAYAWAGLWIALVFWIVALLPLALLLPSLFSLLFRDSSLSADELAEALRRDDLSAQYGRMLLYGAFLTMAACTAQASFSAPRSLET